MVRHETLNNDEIEILGVELIHNLKTHELRLADEEDTDGLDSITGVGIGKPHDPYAEKKRLSKSLKRLTICLVMKTSFTSPMALLIEFVGGDEAVMAQVESHSTEQVMHGWFPKRLTDLVLDSITDHEKLSMEILDNDENQKRFALLILRLLSGTSKHGEDLKSEN